MPYQQDWIFVWFLRETATAAYFAYMLTAPCFIGLLLARYRNGRWGGFILGCFMVAFFGLFATGSDSEYGNSRMLFRVMEALFNGLFLLVYFLATRYEIQRRKREQTEEEN